MLETTLKEKGEENSFTMIKKMIIRKRIENYEKQIIQLEQKLLRSESAYVRALLEHKTPEKEDVYYHNKYTKEITGLRKRIQQCRRELEAL